MVNNNGDTKDKSSEMPTPEVLKPQDGNASTMKNSESSHVELSNKKMNVKYRRATYRPSHRATFIGLAVVVVILAINAGIITYFITSQNKDANEVNQDEVVISTDVLDKLGVSRNTIDSKGTELIVGPDASFQGTLTVAGDTSIAGQLNLNGKFAASDISAVNFEAGETAIEKLNVNGDATISNLNLREDLTVVGQTSLQGSVSISQLLTVNNNVNIIGNLAIGGTLSIGNFQTNILTVGGHIVTKGSAPSISAGSALGNNGTISISGNDVSGTVAVNIGTGASSGIVAYISFVNQYTDTPHVVISPIGAGIGSFYVNRTSSGFNIGVNGPLSPGGYAFDYIVMQ